MWFSRFSLSLASTDAGEKLLRSIRGRDITLRVSTKDGNARIVFASTTNLLRETMRRHKLLTRMKGQTPFLELVGTHLTFTNILAALQEGEERVATRLSANEGTIVTESLAIGECRCYVGGHNGTTLEEEPHFPLKVDRFLYGQSQPFSSITAASLTQLIDRDYNATVSSSEGFCSTAQTPETAVPLLGLGMLSPEVVDAYYRRNITLHGHTFFRQSEGSVAALWCCAYLDDPSLLEAFALYSEASAASESPEAVDRVDEMMRKTACSCGVLVQPVVAGRVVEEKIHLLQRLLVRASIVQPEIFSVLKERGVHEGLACQDSIALVTGDHEGAYEVAKAARQFTQDPSVSAPVVEKVREGLGLDKGERFFIDQASVVRNGIDYFCRCSKNNFLRALVALPEEQLSSLMEETSFRCTFCAKEHVLQPEDWSKLLRDRTSFKK
ncbi:hypothetical protein, conserved [Trypanosoma brucei brucei TREU927]|uniref:Uncharacterized protein n=1 Tax=Trypanosoma brucei brucei (strain 927/4 GUTat10.1) TaxID=185431 RepID=Q583S1_TRYB2|nr:hypothetical protein, conserved [Trypanosoma brucei brucei TREU927]AAX80966.1 hypothetical protein, conserved [Trypanosoma brucei]AAZ11825.1 hypothetical protein, conserved [Trypanosoma brucei brucei TREU927]